MFDFRREERYGVIPIGTGRPKQPPPHGLTIFKGSKNVVLNRTFAGSVFKHPYTKDFLKVSAERLFL